MKTIYRTLMNEALAAPLAEIKGKVLDLAGGNMPSYRRYLRVEATEVTATDLRAPGAAPVDFDKPLPYGDHAFDAVLFVNAIYIAADPVATLREIRRVLTPRGTLVLVTPFIFPETREPHDYFRWTSEGIERALHEAGFDTIESRPFGNYVTSALFILEAFLVFRPVKWVAQHIARALDRLVPKSYSSKRPCPLGYVVIANRL